MNGYQILRQLKRAVNSCVVVSNSWLPEDFQDHRTNGVTLRDLNIKCDARDRKHMKSEHEIEKREKNLRIELYAKMAQAEEPIRYLEK